MNENSFGIVYEVNPMDCVCNEITFWVLIAEWDFSTCNWLEKSKFEC